MLMWAESEFIAGINAKTREQQLGNDGIYSIPQTITDWPAVYHGIMLNDIVFEREPEYTEAGVIIFHQQLWYKA